MAKNFLSRARSWAARNKLLGPQAFLKYVIFTYLDALNRVSDEFVFKGGNLLWAYIRTPRATVDLDLSTLAEADDRRVRKLLESVTEGQGVSFQLQEFLPTRQESKRGAAVTIAYKTDAGAENKFRIDVVYAAPADAMGIESLVETSTRIQAATIENIIADKLLTVQRFGSGNTRMKDFDDLWRISQSKQQVEFEKLWRLLKDRGIDRSLSADWISDQMKSAWANHRKRYKDLPSDLEELFRQVNRWLS